MMCLITDIHVYMYMCLNVCSGGSRIWGGGGGHKGRCGYRLGRVVGGAAPGRVREWGYEGAL